MLRTMRFGWAVNRVLYDLLHRGRITKARLEEMRSVAGNGANLSYGVALLRSGAARSKEAAAAAVFARIAGAAQCNPTGTIRSEDWQAAARQALLNAGAEEVESYLLVAGLVDDIQAAEADALPQLIAAQGGS